ncbi:MAG: SpoIIE family protein phosphatase [Thermoleophilaceae bacterium]
MTRERRAAVLLVDDEPDNLVALTAVLEPLDCDLVQATSGEEALRLLLSRDYAVILLDVRMPGLDGFDTAALIKERDRTRHIPIIFVTAVSKDTEHVSRGYWEGAVDYLLKPYDPAVLRSKVSVFVALYEQTAALEESEDRFRTAFANAPSGMAIVSTDGRLIQVNRAFSDLLGHSQADLAGARWESIVDPDERAQDREVMRALAEGERGGYQAERRCLHADGRVLLVALRVSTTGGGDRPLQLIAQLEDVTERERAERERAERLREQAARAEAETVAQMVRNLQSVSDTALTHLALDDLMPQLLERIGEIFGADSVSVLLSDPDGDGLVLRASRGVGASEDGKRIPLGRGTFAGRVVKERRPIVIGDVQDESGADIFDVTLRESGVRSLMGVPLIAEGEVGGVVRVGSLTAERFDDNDAALLALVADRAALAIGNAGLYEREHKIVETLQRSLLPARLPKLPGISIAARYLPGGADVGGDWYDAIALGGGGVGIAMGDVVGHGLEAAAMMGELRNALRAYALESVSPAEIVTKLDRLVEQMEGAQMATLVYAVIDSDWAEVRFAAAGHPPPLLLGPDGGVDYLWDARSTPLGVGSSGQREEGSASLDGGSALVLYTDGLIEVRGEALTAGLDRLKRAVSDGPSEPEALCDHVIQSLLGSRGSMDDVALLALRTMPLAPEQMRLELPPDRGALVYARRVLARWLEQAGATDEEAYEIQLASHEACANAIEHGHRFGDALVELEAQVVDGEVALTVRDSGRWREQKKEQRGKGIRLMNALMHDVHVNGGPEGTTVELRRRLAAAAGSRT